MTPTELAKKALELDEKASPKPWTMWVVTTSPQTTPTGEKCPLIHGAAPPHEFHHRAFDKDVVGAAGRDSEFIAFSRSALSDLAREVLRLTEENEALNRKLNTATDGLKFYAMDVNWIRDGGMDAKLMRDDRGWRARACLKLLEQSK